MTYIQIRNPLRLSLIGKFLNDKPYLILTQILYLKYKELHLQAYVTVHVYVRAHALISMCLHQRNTVLEYLSVFLSTTGKRKI